MTYIGACIPHMPKCGISWHTQRVFFKELAPTIWHCLPTSYHGPSHERKKTYDHDGCTKDNICVRPRSARDCMAVCGG